MAEPLMTNTGGDKPLGGARLARAFASPGGVLIILPALVIAAGVAVLLLGRRATRDTAENMARHQLVAQAKAVTQDVEFALDQATPVLATMKTLAVEAMPTPDALIRLHDAVLGRPGIWNASIAFPSGVMWGTYVEPSKDGKEKLIRVQESKVSDDGVTARVNYRVEAVPIELSKETNNYDPRQRPHYRVAVDNKKRTWMPPRVFSTSGKTGITVSEPVYGPDGSLQAVMTIDFDVESLSLFIRNPPIAGARNVMFTADGTILAYPENAMPTAAAAEKRLLHHSDFKDAALTALFKVGGGATQQRFVQLKTEAGDYFASIAVVGGKRAGTESTLDWYLATLVPESTLFGAMKRLSRDSIIASGAALAIAMGVALMFAWNILRMRRTVSAAREAARSAELRAKQLGSYRLVERLGAGGMGEVWRAEHQLLARKAAIKLVRKDVVRDRQHAELIQERFRREAQVLASMRSRHTIELYDYGVTDDGTFFYVMELLEGLDLAILVRDYGPQPAARVIQIVSQACQSLAEAHDAGLLHRDIKPANIELCRAADEVDIIKVLDFGIVHNISDPVAPSLPATSSPDDVTVTPERKSSPAIPLSNESGERLTTEGVVIGTPGYIPPEQAIAAPLHPRGDIYALACVAWYLLTGVEIYVRSTEEEILRAHVMEKIPNLREKVRGWLPPELEQLMYQCLAKEPDERPDARTLAKALSKIVVPAEHAWTEEMAQTWWESLSAPAPASGSMAAATVPDGGRMLVPARATTQAAPGSEQRDARTIEARPSSRNL